MNYNVPVILRSQLRVFSLVGYCGTSLSDDSKRKVIIERWLLLWSSLLLVTFNVLAFVALLSDDDFLFKSDKFGYFNDILKVSFANIAVTVSYLETILKRSDIKRFWKIYDILQNKSNNKKYLILLNQILEYKRFFGIFYAFLFVEISVIVTFIIFQNMSRHLILFWGIFTPFMFSVHLRNMQFIFYVEVIRLELFKLKNDLKLMANFVRVLAFGSSLRGLDEYLRQQLVLKQKRYQMMHEMFQHFHNGFGFSIVAVLLMIYIRVLVDVYFGYYTFYRESKKIEIILLIPPCLQFPTFLISSKSCMELIKYMTFNLHNIISQLKTPTGIISAQLQNFSLQILHQRICISGIGITHMDGYLLTRTIGSATTYMIFFIQFMPKFTTIQDDIKHK